MEINVQELDVMRKDGASYMLLDIREPEEVAICAIDGSVPIPMNTLPDNLARVPKDRPVVVMCHVGGRSWQVTQWLRAQGYQNVVNLMGGISAWAAEIDPQMPTY